MTASELDDIQPHVNFEVVHPDGRTLLLNIHVPIVDP